MRDPETAVTEAVAVGDNTRRAIASDGDGVEGRFSLWRRVVSGGTRRHREDGRVYTAKTAVSERAVNRGMRDFRSLGEIILLNRTRRCWTYRPRFIGFCFLRDITVDGHSGWIKGAVHFLVEQL